MDDSNHAEQEASPQMEKFSALMRQQAEEIKNLKDELSNQLKVEEMKQQMLAKEAELETAIKERAAAEKAVDELKRQLELSSTSLNEKQSEVQASLEETELILHQLHQVQEEMGHYFVQSRDKDLLLKKYQSQQKRVKTLLSRLLASS